MIKYLIKQIILEIKILKERIINNDKYTDFEINKLLICLTNEY